jgi:tagatose-1,6-bisphosphate aldolase
MKQTLSIGKLRGLQQCSDARGTFSVLALDHRQNLRKAMNPQSPQAVSDGDLVGFKQGVIGALAPAATAVLLDPEVGAAQCIASGLLPGRVGLLVAAEATGYGGDPTARQSQLLPGWGVAKAKRLGASAVKLLVYYNPASPTASDIEAFVRQVATDCLARDIALFLEPLSYSLDPSRKKLPSDELRQVVIESARRLVVPGVDVLKAEFPLDTVAQPDPREWAAACRELSYACPVPWVLLSASVDYDVYLRQVMVACDSGASGVAVGRAVWKEAVGLSKEDREAFLRLTAHDRLARLTALCQALARPWTEFFVAPVIEPGWYAGYS